MDPQSSEQALPTNSAVLAGAGRGGGNGDALCSPGAGACAGHWTRQAGPDALCPMIGPWPAGADDASFPREALQAGLEAPGPPATYARRVQKNTDNGRQEVRESWSGVSAARADPGPT